MNNNKKNNQDLLFQIFTSQMWDKKGLILAYGQA